MVTNLPGPRYRLLLLQLAGWWSQSHVYLCCCCCWWWQSPGCGCKCCWGATGRWWPAFTSSRWWFSWSWTPCQRCSCFMQMLLLLQCLPLLRLQSPHQKLMQGGQITLFWLASPCCLGLCLTVRSLVLLSLSRLGSAVNYHPSFRFNHRASPAPPTRPRGVLLLSILVAPPLPPNVS